MRRRLVPWTALLLGAWLAGASAPACADDGPESRRERLKKAWKDQVEGMSSHRGLLHLRKKEGKLYAEIPKKQLDEELLFYASVYRGVGQGWLLGGMMRMDVGWVLEFRAVDDRVQVVRKNIRHRAEPGSPMAGAVETSFTDSVLARLDPVAISPAGSYLVPLAPLLVQADLLDIAGAVGAQLGGGYSVDGSRSRWEQVRSYQQNAELRLNMVLAGGELFASPYAPDGRSVSVGVQYSFRAPPKPGYKARAADDRVGYFLTAHKDYSRTDIEGPWVRSVNRWRLQKADPKAPRSPVKEPIIFYLGRNVPYRWRPYMRAGVLEWNKAFETAGLLDAVEVRYQTDDDEWEAEDVRYNTIRWVLGDVPFGAVGPSRVDPRTGEILDADILFSGDVPRMFWRTAALAGMRESESRAGAERMLEAATWLHGEPAPQAAPLLDSPTPAAPWVCRAAEELAQTLSVAVAAGAGESVASTAATTETSGDDEAADGPPPLPEAFVGAALKWIVMHEVGHTLGLRHNFRASTIRTRAQIQDRAFTKENGLAGSVMDYLPVNFAQGDEAQGEHFMSTVGPYDLWAIQYGYQPVEKDEELAKIAARAAEPELAFSTDEDVHNLFYRKLDPRVHVNDIGDDPLEDARRRHRRVTGLYDQVLPRLIAPGKRYTLARQVVTGLIGGVRRAGEVAAVYVAGAYEHRHHKGDAGGQPPFVPVPAKKQREALEFLLEGVFSDASYQLSPELLNRLAPDHWWHWGNPIFRRRLDYPLHRVVLMGQVSVLVQLVAPTVLERMLDDERRSPPDQDLLTAAELLETLEKGLLRELDAAPEKGTPYVSSIRRSLQRSFVAILEVLANRAGQGVRADARGLARAALGRIQARCAERGQAAGLDPVSRSHLADLEARASAARAAGRAVHGF